MEVNPLTLKKFGNNAALISGDESAEKHIPYTRFLENGIFTTKNGDLGIFFELDGIPHALADDHTLETANNALARSMTAIADGYNMVYCHTLRMKRDTSTILEPLKSDTFAEPVDEQYRRQLASKTLYEIRHFVTLIRRTAEAQSGVIQSAFSAMTGMLKARNYRKQDSLGEVREQRAREIEKLETAASQLSSSLSQFGVRRLNDTPQDRRLALSFLSKLIGGSWKETPATSDFIAHAIPSGRVVFGGESFEILGTSPSENRFGAILAVQAYDEHSFSGMFDELLTEKIEYVVTQSFLPLGRLESRNEASNQAKRLEDSGDDAVASIEDLKDAVSDIARGTMIFGRHHFTITILTDTKAELIDAVSSVDTALGSSGLKMRREDMGLELAFWSQLPANVAYQARSKHRLISNQNFADFCAFHTHLQGEKSNLPWGGPITVFPTYAATAHHFSFHGRGSNTNGNTLIFGPPGSGKTALAGFLISQTRRLKRPPRIIYFDKDRGAETMIRSLGGEYVRLAPEDGSGFNPFQTVSDDVGTEWLAGFIERLVDTNLEPEQLRRIQEAAQRNAEAEDESLKTFSNFVSLLTSVDDAGSGSLVDRLSDWVGQGARSWLFDNRRDTFSISQSAIGIDMTSLLKSPRTRSAALDYLFYRIERLLDDGYPSIIFMDEGWKLLNDDGFADRILDWMKTIRKLNGIICFATQEPADAAKSAISETLIQSAETMIFFASSGADERTYVDGFGLTPIEFETVKSLPREQRTILVKQSAGSILLDARIDDAATLKAFSGTAESVRHMDKMRAEFGHDWFSEYLQRDID